MQYIVRIVLAAGVCAFALLSGFDRERVFYPTLVMVVATYYILFAAMGSSLSSLLVAGGRTCGAGRLRLLSSARYLQSWCAGVVAGILSWVRCAGWWVPGSTADQAKGLG